MAGNCELWDELLQEGPYWALPPVFDELTSQEIRAGATCRAAALQAAKKYMAWRDDLDGTLASQADDLRSEHFADWPLGAVAIAAHGILAGDSPGWRRAWGPRAGVEPCSCARSTGAPGA
jgi:hypothetical protein